MTRARWRKSSFSDVPEGSCVEVSLDLDLAGIRDSKNVTGPTVTVTTETWSTFITHLARD
ncbi:uncharacterized protein DUF397 [Actinokineospora alba]|nr:DUF397 domain-containing protein [Actinokineospora alba]TDP66611.1 uncharacterized protein DUF397 [Actinokineospora alba]